MKKIICAFILSTFMLTSCFADDVSLTVTDSLDVFRAYINNKNCVMLDLRPEAAYQGWKLDGALRGGHVAGAMDFPISWLSLMDDTKLDEVLAQLPDGTEFPMNA